MLRLVDIRKKYKLADGDVEVLKGLNIAFRKNEFVAILGASGSGKTTTLNIIGGLDKYSSGDLFIAGRSTKEFSDRDWDVYRNQRIGFVFQSYNLIPHQTVLENVELALTISGVSKEERVRRAKEALAKVGLTGHYNKRPNQLSGGQCQRVAIARALVNEPEILLADEPTGALDSKTSVQIMNLIKEIAKERLVIMVTHNADLANEYANRIIKLSDGEVIEDSNPYTAEEEADEIKLLAPSEIHKKSKAKMSWWTSFKLSARNLLSKKKRTILTCFAGSIGIIGVSTVLSVSNGVTGYINDMQEDMLSGNPITISENAMDISSILNGMSSSDKIDFIVKEGFANVDSVIEYLVKRYGSMENMMISNEIDENYVKYLQEMPQDYAAAIAFDYGVDMTNNFYVDFKVSDAHEAQKMSLTGIKTVYQSVLNKTDFAKYSSLISSVSDIVMQAPTNEEYILSQYNVLSGKIATDMNEIMIVLDKDQALTDLALSQLGYFTQEEFINIALKSSGSNGYNSDLDKTTISFEELMDKTIVWYPNDAIYTLNTGNPYVPFTYNAYGDGLENGIELKVVGILQPKAEVSYGCLERGFYYTEALTKYAIESGMNSQIVRFMRENDLETFNSLSNQGIVTGITFNYNYEYNGVQYADTGFVGELNLMNSLMSQMPGAGGTTNEIYQLSLRHLGGEELPNRISIYPLDFNAKDKVLDYLDAWNSDTDITIDGVSISKTERMEITYTDTLTIIVSLINSMITLITNALIAFTALSLVVSCVMIAIITYISVVERVKEIGVIRSLGGRKGDVSNLFNAETIIIGTISGVLGVGITYLISAILNLIVGSMIGANIANLSPITAIIMIILSIGLTVLSGLIPAKKAAHQDPVQALRTE